METKVDQLVAMIAGKLNERQRARPALRVVKPSKPVWDSITRDCCIQRIKDLQRMYQLGWLVRQETYNRPGIDSLEDGELSALLSRMEKARECIVEGISFDDAGLVQPNH